MIWQGAADGGQESSVGGLQLGPRRLAAQRNELMAQDQDLQILGGVGTSEQREELDGAAQRQVGESWQHQGAASAMGQGRVTVPTHARRPNPQATAQIRVSAPYGLSSWAFADRCCPY